MIRRKIWQLLRIVAAVQLIGILYMFMTYEFKPDVSLIYGYSDNLVVGKNVLEELDFPPKSYVSLSSDTMEDYVFVTAASSGFIPAVLDGIASVQKYYPKKKVIFYDLDEDGRSEGKFTGLCNVEYRRFMFDKYPKHVRKLRTYTWKPLIIYDVLRAYPGVYWMDASVRMLSSDMEITHPMVLATGGIILFNYAGHSTFSATHPAMYDYIRTDVDKLKEAFQYECGSMLLFRTKAIFNDVVKWWVLCALIERCMAPSDHMQGCNIKSPDTYANCHRYDQSAMNVLLNNKFNFDYTKFAKHYDNLEVVRRGSSGSGQVKTC